MRALTPIEEKYILHWGELGTRWGVNRTIAQIHALLMISEEPLNAEDISTALGIARSNTSNSIKELIDWGLVKTVHKLGDRKDYFETLSDVWDTFWAVCERRVNKEIKPTMDVLSECLDEMDKTDEVSAYTRQRLQELYDFTKMTTDFYDKTRALPTETLLKMVAAENFLDKMKTLFGK